ncbi:MAG TPA: enoyl-CoA hydratase/isomerase family protein [Candidatus Dormibacteraeota bacterium]|nr:enoyl-CoA hydratase/isomerase family protein [Candidatus Dormibacteraeota bacterium]
MSFRFWRLERRDRVAILAIDRPEAANAIDQAVLAELEEALRRLETEPRLRAILFTGAGGVFSAGGDIRTMRDMTVEEGRRFVEDGHRVLDAIAASHLVSVAAIDGAALGGGAELALACDLRIASERAVLGFPEVQLGLYPGWGGTQRAVRVLGPSRAKLLMLTGERVDARQAFDLGLVDRVVPADRLLPACLELAERVAVNSPTAVRQTKMAIVHGSEQALATALRLEIEGWMVNFATPDRVEGLTAFLERRAPRWSEP